MKDLYKQKREQGFTIIEVLIVLAIAAVILLIVFLAVPALQRNSRNNGIRNDASNIIAAVNEFVANNNGSLPTGGSVVCATGTVTVNGAAGTQPSTSKVRSGTGCSLVTADTFAAVGSINIRLDVKCNGNTGTTALTRGFVALYRVETGTGDATQCLES